MNLTCKFLNHQQQLQQHSKFQQMRKTKSEQKYLPKLNQINIEPDFQPLSNPRNKSASKLVQPTSIEEPSTLSKTKSLKAQILRIPKARQLLNMDKHIYIQDVQKRMELLGDIREENHQPHELQDLQGLCKPAGKKKTRRHKTNFKIPLTRKNIDKMNLIIQQHIDANRKLKNKDVFLLPDYEKTAPFNLEALRFIDDLNEVNKVYKQKFSYEKGNLSKNKLLLEHVILNRNVKRELKLNKDKDAKQHGKRINATLSSDKLLNAKLL